MKLILCVFSPTGGTARVLRRIGDRITKAREVPTEYIDFTRKENRTKEYCFAKDDLVLVGMPVYAGRLPNKIAPDLAACLHGGGARAAAVCCYGNRDPGDAVTELQLILQRNDFSVLGTAAVVSVHPFSERVGAGRPDARDWAEIDAFADRLAALAKGGAEPLHLPEDCEPAPYYVPKKEDGIPAKFLKAAPVTDLEKCNGCGLCAAVCPMGSIAPTDCTAVTGICIKCQACIKACPQGAKRFADADFLSHVRMLEKNFTVRNTNRFYTAELR